MNPVPLFLIIVTLPLIPERYLSAQQSENAIAVGANITIKNKDNEINIKELETHGEGPELKNPVLVKKQSGIPFSGRVFELYKNGQRRASGSLKNGKHQDSWLFWYDDGSKKCEATFNKGNRNGLWVFWHKNNQKKYIGNYKNGKMDGSWLYWYENGHKRFQGIFKDGKEQGKHVRWHENGQKKAEENFKDGKLVGGSAKYWNSKGKTIDSLEGALK